MNYLKIHDDLILKAKRENRNKLNGIYELHHILMKSLGGDDSEENTVLLTPKEHYLIHLLLWKIHSDYKYLAPLLFFKNKGAINSRIYKKLREEHIEHMKNDNPATRLSEKSKISKSIKLKNRKFSEEHRRKISNSKKGKSTRSGAVLDVEQKNKISNSLKLYYEINEVSLETREKISVANTGKKHSEEALKKQRNAALSRPRYVCDICSSVYDAGNMTQHMIKKHGIVWNKTS